MFEDENEYFTALGLNPPEPDDPDAAEEAGEPDAGTEESVADEGEGANEREDAGPAGEDVDEMFPDEPPEDGDGGANEQEPAEPVSAQPKDVRAKNAERRRQREEFIRRDERAKLDAEVRAVFERAGFKDGDKAITTVAELGSFLDRQAAQKLESELKSGTLTPESFKSAVAAQVAAEVARQRPPEPDPQPDTDAFMRQVAAEIAEIQKYDPTVKGPEDFQKLDRAEEFFDAVTNHGHTFAEAYRYVYADRIAEQKAQQAARQAAQRTRNNDRSKAHLRATGAAGSGDVTVPAAVERNIRAIMPRATAKEIKAYYQKYYKQTGG